MHITHIHLKRNECVLGVAHCALSMAPILIQNRWEFTEWMNEWINKWGHYWMTERMLQAFSDWRLAEDLVLPGLHSIRSKSAFFFFCIRRNKSLIKREKGSNLERFQWFLRLWLLWGGRKGKEDLAVCFGRCAWTADVLGMLMSYFWWKLTISIWTSGFISGGLSAFKLGTESIASLTDIEDDLVNDILARAKFYKRHGF